MTPNGSRFFAWKKDNTTHLGPSAFRERRSFPWPLVSYNLLTSNQIFEFSNSKFCERPYFADRKSVISWRVPIYVWWTLCRSSWWLSNLRDAGECMKWRTGPLPPQWSHVRIHLAWQYNYCLVNDLIIFHAKVVKSFLNINACFLGPLFISLWKITYIPRSGA